MESRTDLVRLLEEMDKVLDIKKKELAELDDRLEVARDKVSQKEASEIQASEVSNVTLAGSRPNATDGPDQEESVKKYIAEQKRMYEQQLAEFAEQLSELEAMNQRLREENHRWSLKDLNKEDTAERIESAYHVLSDQYRELRGENNELRLDLDRLQRQSKEQQNQLEKSNQLDKVLEDLYNNKLESFKKAIELKEQEIEQLRADNQFTLESLGITSIGQSGSVNYSQMSESDPMDTDKRQRVIQIAATIREKDSQIDSLKGQLLEATKELEKSALILESITNQQKRTRNADTENQLSLTEQLNEVNQKCDSLERELIYKDRRLNDIEIRNQDLEFLMPQMVTETLQALALRLNSSSQGTNEMIDNLCQQLSNLLNEMNTAQGFLRKNDELKDLLRSKDQQILQLVNDLNQLHDQFDIAVRGIKTGPTGVKDDTSSKSNTNDDESVDEKDRSSDPPMPGVLSEDDTVNRTEEQQNEQPGVALATKLSLEADMMSEILSSRREMLRIESVLDLQKRVRQLEDENNLLELAMKEILLCIRWSDSQCSTLLIDCPSLERLCQIIEAKFVAESGCPAPGCVHPKEPSDTISQEKSKMTPDMFQFCLLKSELDILRGQNVQLRADIKTQRRELKELLSKDRNVDTCILSTTSLSTKSDNLKSDVISVDKSDPMSHQGISNPGNNSDEGGNSSAREAECQTELTLDSMNTLVEKVQSQAKSSDEIDCQSCNRLTGFIKYLAESIAKLESRISLSDHGYMQRFEDWYKLIQGLSRDLSESTETVKELRKECHILRQQKYKADSKFELVEHLVIDHAKFCPTPDSIKSATPQSVKVYTTSDAVQGESIEMATWGRKKPHIELPTTSARVIITLLKSIIGCLQARLVFKDERVRQLETLIKKITYCASPA